MTNETNNQEQENPQVNTDHVEVPNTDVQPEQEQEQDHDSAEVESQDQDQDQESETGGVSENESQESETQEQKEAREEEERRVSQEEFNKLYFQMKQAERERDAALKKAQEREAAKAKEAAERGAPKLEDFDYDEDKYRDAMFEYKVQQEVNRKFQEREEAERERQIKQKEAEIINGFNERASAYAAQNPDYEKAIQIAGESAAYPTHVQEVILTSDHGPQIDYALLTDPDLLNRVSNMSPTSAIMELARLESKFTQQPAKAAEQKKEVKVSKAPNPVPVAGGGGRASDYKYNTEMSAEDYYAAYMAEQAAKRKQ